MDTEVKVPGEQRWGGERWGQRRRQEQVTLGLVGHLKGWSLTVTQSMEILNTSLATMRRNKEEKRRRPLRGPGK